MRYLICVMLAAAFVGSIRSAAEDRKPPAKLVFASKGGEVHFDHAAHLKREKDQCATCHDKLWPQSTKEPMKSSAGCRTCHQAGGAAFEMKDNCKRCHPAGGQA